MKKIILYIWNSGPDEGKPFGAYTDKNQADLALAAAATDIQTTVENLKADLYFYEVPLNKLFLVSQNTILDY